jgi:hypothetical protein
VTCINDEPFHVINALVRDDMLASPLFARCGKGPYHSSTMRPGWYSLLVHSTTLEGMGQPNQINETAAKVTARGSGKEADADHATALAILQQHESSLPLSCLR